MDTRPDWLSLDTDETVVWSGTPRIRRVLPTAVVALCWIALLVLAATLGPRTASVPVPALSDRLLVAGGVLLALPALAAVASSYLRTAAVEYVLTDRNLYRRTGVLSTRVSRVGLSAVERTSLSKGVWGTAFDYGTISISTAGSDGVDLRLADLDDPAPVREEIRRLLGPRRERQRSDSDATPGPVDAATATTLHDEVRALRASAVRVERAVSER
jgi:membrane protein YdbS with pleckstrin-like domain